MRSTRRKLRAVVGVPHRPQGRRPATTRWRSRSREAHARGLELHAWFNPVPAPRIRASTSDAPTSHHASTDPELVEAVRHALWIDPGEPEVRDARSRVILDVVKRYDVDGVHIDDYFYPYPENDATARRSPFPDDDTCARYQKGGGKLARDDWRRDNVDTLRRAHVQRGQGGQAVGEGRHQPVRHLASRALRLEVAGLRPVRPSSTPTRGSGCSEGWCDYFAPQLYWPIEPAKQSFPVLLNWWREQSHGQGDSGRASRRSGWRETAGSEMVRQIELTREGDLSNNAPGHIHWSMKALMRNAGGIRELLATTAYRDGAIIPASPWLGSGTPDAPTIAADGQNVTWKAVGRTAPARWAVQTKKDGRWQTRVFPAGVMKVEQEDPWRNCRSAGGGPAGQFQRASGPRSLTALTPLRCAFSPSNSAETEAIASSARPRPRDPRRLGRSSG